ncbi:MAG: CCA tRNA nucleotidyltransferase [Clostridia bacterium]|nr:CCA tRNA nucleotidyltransferase [Clostridia bacterium]
MELKDYLKNNKVLSILNDNGFEAYFVGGVVRDYIMNRPSADFDITTNATPQEVKSLFENTFDTGIKHGTVTIKHDGHLYEVTTYRQDAKYLNYRHPSSVKYVGELRKDLNRRDFTINAIALDKELTIQDFHHGMEDIEKGIIRTVGNAEKRFKEDALRMLRAIRISTQLGFDIEEKTLQAIYQNSHLINHISKERIYSEFKKALMGDHLKNIVHLTCFDDFKNFNFNDIPEEKDFVLRLTAVIKDLPSLEKLITLKAEKNVINEVMILKNHIDDKDLDDRYQLKKLISIIGKENAKKILILKKLPFYLYESILESHECLTLGELVITGKDLISQSIVSEGREVGIMLNRLLDEVLRNPSLNNYEDLITLSKSFR